ncbi:MAG TPA: stalk domain-containing protein, partial [Anaerovoracaceae bacterium]|nr:stalk domain-containing protein [Anaerovoracaceae bacterium]
MKSRIRLLITILTVLAMFFSLNISAYAGTKDTTHISIGGQVLDIGAIEGDGTVFLPLRSVCETLGYSVEWSKENGSVTVKDLDKTVLFEPKTDTITDAGHSYYVNENYIADGYIGGGCILLNSHIYVAADIMESCFGIADTYDQANHMIMLSLAPQGKITAENKIIYSEDSKLLSNIQYPYISEADKAAADKINAAILADVNMAQKEAQDNLKDYGDYQSPNRFET